MLGLFSRLLSPLKAEGMPDMRRAAVFFPLLGDAIAIEQQLEFFDMYGIEIERRGDVYMARDEETYRNILLLIFVHGGANLLEAYRRELTDRRYTNWSRDDINRQLERRIRQGFSGFAGRC